MSVVGSTSSPAIDGMTIGVNGAATTEASVHDVLYGMGGTVGGSSGLGVTTDSSTHDALYGIGGTVGGSSTTITTDSFSPDTLYGIGGTVGGNAPLSISITNTDGTPLDTVAVMGTGGVGAPTYGGPGSWGVMDIANATSLHMQRAQGLVNAAIRVPGLAPLALQNQNTLDLAGSLLVAPPHAHLETRYGYIP
jgi:hypothetical protein